MKNKGKQNKKKTQEVSDPTKKDTINLIRAT